jgi:hypothetical protein
VTIAGGGPGQSGSWLLAKRERRRSAFLVLSPTVRLVAWIVHAGRPRQTAFKALQRVECAGFGLGAAGRSA